MTSADGGSYAVQCPCDGWVDYYTWKSGTHTIDGSNTQAGSIFYRQQVESANAEQYAYQNISTSASDATTLVASAPPPFFFGQKRLRTLPHYKRLCTGMRDLHTSSRKHRLSVQAQYLLWAFVNCVSNFGVVFFARRPKIEPSSALLFLVFGCFVKTCNVGETTESTSHRY